MPSGISVPAAVVTVPDQLFLSHLPLLVRPCLNLARRGRAVIGLVGDSDSVHRFAAALLAFGLPEDAALLKGTPALPALPLPRVEDVAAAAALDGLPLFPTESECAAFVAGLPADGRLPGEPKDPQRSEIFRLFTLLADPVRTETLRLRFVSGISWNDARTALAGQILRATGEARRQFEAFSTEVEALDDLLIHGAARAAGRLPMRAVG